MKHTHARIYIQVKTVLRGNSCFQQQVNEHLLILLLSTEEFDWKLLSDYNVDVYICKMHDYATATHLWMTEEWRTLIGAVTMAQSAANWRNTHTHMDNTYSLTHFTLTQLQPRCAKRQLSYYFSVHARSVRVSVIHRTLTWTTWSLLVGSVSV